jgi:DNA-binding NarL/FixJ family response regulator
MVTAKKTVLIVDDHPFFREGLKAIIARDPRFEVVSEAENGQECLEAARKCKPDLVLMDISLPDTSGIHLTSMLLRLLPETRVIMVSMHLKTNTITEAFQAGAMGYVSKESATEKLLECLTAVCGGDYFLDSAISHQVAQILSERPAGGAGIADDLYHTLTSREQQVMRLIAEGLSTPLIAEKLCLSPKTVDNHRTRILAKLHLHSTIELIRYAAKLGLIDVDLWKN